MSSASDQPKGQGKMSVLEMLNTLRNLCAEVEQASQVKETPPIFPTINLDLHGRTAPVDVASSVGQEVLRQYSEVTKRNELLTKEIETLDEENYTLWEKNKAITDENIGLKLLLAQHAIPLEGVQSFHLSGASIQQGQATFRAVADQDGAPSDQSVEDENLPSNAEVESDQRKSMTVDTGTSQYVVGDDMIEDSLPEELHDAEAVAEAVDSQLLKFVTQNREGFRCRVAHCRKRFKEESAWRQHVRDAHSEWLVALMQEVGQPTSHVHHGQRELWEHERKHQVEVKVLELEDRLRDEGLDQANIEGQKQALRTKLLMAADETKTEEWNHYLLSSQSVTSRGADGLFQEEETEFNQSYTESSGQELRRPFASLDYNVNSDRSSLQRTEAMQHERQWLGRTSRFHTDLDAPSERYASDLDYGQETDAMETNYRATKIKKETKEERPVHAVRSKVSFGFPKRPVAGKGKGIS